MKQYIHLYGNDIPLYNALNIGAESGDHAARCSRSGKRTPRLGQTPITSYTSNSLATLTLCGLPLLSHDDFFRCKTSRLSSYRLSNICKPSNKITECCFPKALQAFHLPLLFGRVSLRHGRRMLRPPKGVMQKSPLYPFTASSTELPLRN